MRVRARVARLELAETFTISRGSSDHEDVVQVELEHDGIVGYGEAAPAGFLGETVAGTLAFVEGQAPAALGEDPFALEEIGRRLATVPGNPRGQGRAGRRAARLGRQASRPADLAAARLAGLPAERRVPLFVDEGCTELASVAEAARYADGVNIKIDKAGGIREALRMVHAARALGLRVMLGCMVASELGIAQAAQLASLVDHVDLDGHLLLAESPFVGLGLEDGRVVLPDRPGLGVRPR
jgi:L-alanine-DL-glutamate epimerase-like enolase superfamily enzyme